MSKYPIYDRIQSAYQHIGCKNDSQFAEYVKKHGEGVKISKANLYQWGTGSTPDVDKLICISDLCGCDIDYLLGRQSCMRKDESTVHDIIGLSEEAIRELEDYNFPTFGSRDIEREKKAFNWFIENGLMHEVAFANSVLREQIEHKIEYDRLPDDIKELFEKAVKEQRKRKGKYYTVDRHLIMLLLSKDLEELKRLNALSIEEIKGKRSGHEGAPYEVFFEELHFIDPDNEFSLSDEKNAIILMLFNKLYFILDTYLEAPKEERMAFFEIYDSYLDLVKEYYGELVKQEHRFDDDFEEAHFEKTKALRAMKDKREMFEFAENN